MNTARTELFVPLTAGLGKPGASARAGLKVLSAGQAPAFRALDSTTPAGGRVGHGGCEPKVSVLRDGDRVTSIQILCACGQVIDLACVYQNDQV